MLILESDIVSGNKYLIIQKNNLVPILYVLRIVHSCTVKHIYQEIYQNVIIFLDNLFQPTSVRRSQFDSE